MAVVILTSMVLWMRKAARSIKTSLHASIDEALIRSGTPGIALVGLVFFAVAREGLESVFFLLAIFQQSPGGEGPLGALIGIAVSVALGYGIYAGGVRLDLARFFRWTGIFILFVAAGLLAGAVRHLHEAGVWNGLQSVVVDLHSVLPADGVSGTILSGLFGYQDDPRIGELLAYAAYLGVTLFLFLRPAAPKLVAGGAPPPRFARKSLMPGTPTLSVPQRSQRLLSLGAGAAALLMVGGRRLVLPRLAEGGREGARRRGDRHAAGGACEPNALTVPAGRAEFRIGQRHRSRGGMEILDGVMVVEERENIAPGIAQTIGARLKAGQYAITCGLLSNPRGIPTVTPSAGSGDGARPSLVALHRPARGIPGLPRPPERRARQGRQGRSMPRSRPATSTRPARFYVAARLPYRRIEPMASRFADLDNALDPVATYLESREEDSAFTGFHRIEYGLFAKNSLDGLRPVSARLLADATTLKDRLRTTRLGPEDMGLGAAHSIAALAENRVPGGENLYAKTDLADFEAEMAGIAKIVKLLSPVASPAAPNEVRDVEAEARGGGRRSRGAANP